MFVSTGAADIKHKERSVEAADSGTGFVRAVRGGATGGVLLVAAPWAARVTPCKFDSLRCRTNEDCCSGVCTANVCAPRTTKCQAFPATGQTTSFHAGDDGATQAGAPLSYTDNGDGTITDENTGLMWEK